MFIYIYIYILGQKIARQKSTPKKSHRRKVNMIIIVSISSISSSSSSSSMFIISVICITSSCCISIIIRSQSRNRHLRNRRGFQWDFPTDLRWHFPTEFKLSAVCSKGMSLSQLPQHLSYGELVHHE